MNTKIPFQFSKYGNLIKSILHTNIGAAIGYHLGVSGFNRVDVVHTDGVTGKILSTSHSYNARTNIGAQLVGYLMTGTAFGGITSPTYPIYVALSANVLTPAMGDTTLSGEIVSAGLTRSVGAAGTYVAPTVLDGAASYQVTKTFTNNIAGAVTVQSSGLLDAASAGNLYVESNMATAAILQNTDTLAVTWTVNI
jgi:hypothetical protein